MASNYSVFLESLQQDLRNLSAEAKKKHNPIKEGCEKCIMLLRGINEKKELEDDKQRAHAVAELEDIVKIFLTSIDTKNSKMITISVSTLHKLIVQNAASQSSISVIIPKLESIATSVDEAIQLKILQTLLGLLSTQNTVHGKQLAMIFVCFFKLQNSKNFAVQNTASASIRQSVTMMFDKTLQELDTSDEVEKTTIDIEKDIGVKPMYVPTTLFPCAIDAYLLFQDICNMSGGDIPLWLELESINKDFGLELIESVINSHSQVFVKMPEFGVLLKDRVCPLLIKTFKMSHDFPTIIRLVRTIAAFIKNFNDLMVTECEVFLSRLVRILDPHNPLWIQTISLEVFKQLCENTTVLKSFYQYYDQAHEHKSAKIFSSIIAALGQFVDTMFNWDNVLVSKASAVVKTKYIDMLANTEPPAVNESYVVCLALECLIGIINGIFKLIKSTQEEDKKIASSMCSACWPTLLASLSLLLEKSNDESIITDILKSYQIFIQICGELHQATGRDAFLTSLSKFTLPRLNAASPPSVSTNLTVTATILSQKNMLTIKTFFIIAQTMGNFLDTSWEIVLENIRQLDKVLHAPQKVQIEKNEGSLNSNELNTLSSSLDQLFKSTQQLDNASVAQVISSLQKISSESLSNSTTQSRVLFAASKMLECSLHNIHRISVFWIIILEHFTVLSSNKEPTIRNFGVDALNQVIGSALSLKESDIPEHLVSKEKIRPVLDMQNEFLETLQGLSRSEHQEIREKSFHTLFNILQASGQVLTKGWPLVLSTVMTAASNNDKPLIPLAFKSVQLICTDFLSYLTYENMSLYITLLGTFCTQTADTNKSLTAINLLMDVADFIANDKESMRTDSNRSNSLWILVFLELKKLAPDNRYEVRNAAQTLFKTLATHASLFDNAMWDSVIWKILLPALVEVRIATANASTDEVTDSKFLVHHSRNTMSKQFHDSLLHFLGGVVRLFKSEFSVLRLMLPRFDEAWEQLFNEIKLSAMHSSTEVAVSAIKEIGELLSGYTEESKDFSQNLWEIGWKFVEEISIGLMEQENSVHHTILETLGNTVLNLFNTIRSSFTDKDMKRLLHVLRPLIFYPPTVETELSPMQNIVLSVFKQIPTKDENFPYLFSETLNYISFCIGYSYKCCIIDEELPSKTPSQIKSFLPLANRLVSLSDSFFGHASPYMKTRAFGDTAKVLGAAMMTKYSFYQMPLWVTSVESFISIAKKGLPDLNQSSEISDVRNNLIWTELADSIEGFLFHEDRKNIPQSPPDVVKWDEGIDISLCDLIAKYLLAVSAKVPLMHQRLIDILFEGAKLSNSSREFVAEGCYKNLFYLCSVDGKEEEEFSCHMKIAKMVIPLVMARCREVLQKFIQDDKKQGGLPIARGRLMEVSFILSQLLTLELHPEVDFEKPSSVAVGKKRHLLKLFPLLCDCITTRESEIKPLLQEIFHQVAKELCLE